MLKAKCVSPVSTIGIFAPASPAGTEVVDAGLAYLKGMGYSCQTEQKLDQESYQIEHGFACGAALERAKAFNDLLTNKKVAALIASRGGYGAIDLLPLIDFELVRQERKLIIGYSDVSALLLAIYQLTDLACIHGASLAVEFAQASANAEAAKSVVHLMQLVSDTKYRPEYDLQILRSGNAQGPIIATNLSILMSLMGTPWEPSLDDAILVVEEVGEAPYRVQRMLTQLSFAGKLDRLAGLVFGRFSVCEVKAGPTIDQVLQRSVKGILKNTSFPIAWQLAVGHNGENLPLALGCMAKINGTKLTMLESPIE